MVLNTGLSIQGSRVRVLSWPARYFTSIALWFEESYKAVACVGRETGSIPVWTETLNFKIIIHPSRRVSEIKLYAPFWWNWLFFWNYKMAYYSAHFHEMCVLKKSIFFVKFKKQNAVCAHEFSWFRQKKGQESHMYHIQLS